MLNTQQITQQKTAIEELYKLVQEAPDSERKDSAIAYCEGCIAACDLGLKVLASQSKATKKEEAPKPEEAATEEIATEEPVKEEKPKRKRTTKKKEEAPKVEEPTTDDVAEDDDLDDLL